MFYALKDIAEKLAHTGKVEPTDSTISSQLILSGSSVLRILYLNMGFGVPSAHRLVFGTGNWLLRYGIPLTHEASSGRDRRLPGKGGSSRRDSCRGSFGGTPRLCRNSGGAVARRRISCRLCSQRSRVQFRSLPYPHRYRNRRRCGTLCLRPHLVCSG